MARKQYRTWPQGQSFLFPPSPEEWLPDDHLVYFLLDVVDVLDITAIEQVIQNKDPRGEWPYNPRMMLALLVYSYCSGIYSSRKIAIATHEQVAFRVLTGNQHPHFTRISALRREHLAAFRGLFVQVLQLCQDAGLVKLGHVALDGTKVPANASKHKAMSYDRMKQLDLKLGAEIDELLARAKAADSADDARLGVGQDESDIPEELRRRKDRRSKLRAAKAALEAEAKAARAQHELELADGCDERADTAEKDSDRKRNNTLAAQHRKAAEKLADGKDGDDQDPAFTTPDGLPMHRPKTETDGTPKDKAQRNFTDPESRIMPSGGGYIQGYNAQTVVDEPHQIVVAASVTNQSPDAGNLAPMLTMAIDNLGIPPAALTADTGFWTPTVEQTARDLGTEAYVALGRQKHGEAVAPPDDPDAPEPTDPRARMDQRLRSPEGKAVYARRKATVEPIYGQIKECRGFRRFSMRGLAAVSGEWDLVCLTHNLLKLFRAGRAATAAG